MIYLPMNLVAFSENALVGKYSRFVPCIPHGPREIVSTRSGLNHMGNPVG